MRLAGTDLTGLDEQGFRRLRGKQSRHDPAGPEIFARSGDDRRPTDRRDPPLPFPQLREGRARGGAGNAGAVHIRDPERVYAQYPHQVSGGMGQRVMIAMMLIAGPDLLIADEPTSALDVTVQHQVLAIMDDLVRSRGMGLILISHNLHLVSSFCDRVLVMYGGRDRRDLRGRRLHEGETSLHAWLARIAARTGPPARGASAIAA